MESLARFKDRGSDYKVELCMYFGESFVVRGLAAPGDRVNPEYARRLDDLFGEASGWRQILAARDDGVIDAARVRSELVNLMRWRLESDLGYKTTLFLKVRNTNDNQLFTLIFATDHDVGSKIMRHLFRGAEMKLDTMVDEARYQRLVAKHDAVGQDSIFGEADDRALAPRVPRTHPPEEPPEEPYRYHREWDRDR